MPDAAPLTGGDVHLRIDGQIYAGWESVNIHRSIDYLADSFALAVTDDAAQSGRKIKLGSACEIWIDDERVITGYVDGVQPSYSATRRGIAVSGRSKTADLIDCSLPPSDPAAGQQSNRTLYQIATRVAARFGIKVINKVEGLQRIQNTALSPQQTCFEFLETLARADGVRLVSDPDGNLVIIRASSETINTVLALGENIEEAHGQFDMRDRFSDYYVLSQNASIFDSTPEPAVHISGSHSDAKLRFRPTTMVAEDPMNGIGMAKRRAWNMCNVNYGRSRRAKYTVNGWRHKDGLWTPNTNVYVKDAWMGFEDENGRGEWLMIGSVKFFYDQQGQRSRLTVMPKAAYDLIPLPASDEGVW